MKAARNTSTGPLGAIVPHPSWCSYGAQACDCCDRAIKFGDQYIRRELDLRVVSLPYYVCDGCYDGVAEAPDLVHAAIVRRAGRYATSWAACIQALLASRAGAT